MDNSAQIAWIGFSLWMTWCSLAAIVFKLDKIVKALEKAK